MHNRVSFQTQKIIHRFSIALSERLAEEETTLRWGEPSRSSPQSLQTSDIRSTTVTQTCLCHVSKVPLWVILFLLPVMFNFLYLLTRLRDAQIASKTWFLGVSLRVFLERISSPISRLSKEICPHQHRWASFSLPRAHKRQRTKRTKGRGRATSSFPFLSWDILLPLFSDIRAPDSQAFRLRDLKSVLRPLGLD